MEHNVRGVAVMTSEISLRLIHELARRRIAVTFLPVRSYMSNLRIDYFSGVEQIVKYLHTNGHRRIAFIAGRPRLKSNLARLQAYEKCMQDLGLELGPIMRGDLRFEGGLAGLAIAKSTPMPTAVVAVNDLTAVAVIKGLLGKMAADALHELSRSADPQGKEYQIPAELILGDSSGPAPFE